MTDRAALVLADFAGSWDVTRRITDFLGADGSFTGTARFDADDAGLAYHEQGWLRIGDGAALAAERRYLWRGEGSLIAVHFDDSRLFHRFDPRDGAPEARHDCAPDLYLATYEFADWPRWQVEWRVTGPRKDYRMVTRYLRPDLADL